MRWIKASERMPTKEGRTVVKRLGECMMADALLRKSGVMIFATPNGMTWSGYKDFEWLDESVPTSVEDEAKALYPYPDESKHDEWSFSLLKGLADRERAAHITCAKTYLGEIEKLRGELEKAKDWRRYMPVMANIPTERRGDISRDWQYLWSEIEGWYGDITQRESGNQFLLRMQTFFNLTLATEALKTT